MAVPSPLPEIGQFVKFRDNNGNVGWAIVSSGPVTVNGEDFLVLVTGSPNGVNFDLVTFDATGAANNSWNYDPRFPAGFFPDDVAALASDLAQAQSNITALQGAVTALQSAVTALQDAMTPAQSAITALQTDSGLHTTALAQIRTRYPAHFHGLLGLGGDPVGSDGDLSYTLPGD